MQEETIWLPVLVKGVIAIIVVALVMIFLNEDDKKQGRY